jgi:glucosamine--fructose-6-phosphate aminotransferase (isomerizing)
MSTGLHEQSLGKQMEREIFETPFVFERLIQNQNQFENCVKQIKSKTINSIQILARGTSDNAAIFLKYLLETHLGIPVGLAAPSIVTVYKTKLNFENTLVIAVSQSGQSHDLLDYAQAVANSKALLLGITNDANSPLAKICHSHLDVSAGPEIAVAATKSYSAQLLTAYLLVKKLTSEKVFDEAVFQKELQSNLARDISSAVSTLKNSAQVMVLGRGFSYGNSLETGLKIQETCQRNVRGYSLADYMHGPISALEKSATVIICISNGFKIETIKSELDKLRQVSPRIIWVGNTDLAIASDLQIPGANTNDEALNVILDSILLQRIALELSRSLGLDADQPRGLNKVTITK